MSFEKFLYDHFPHRWLDPKKPGTARLIVGLAKTLDYCNELLEMVKRESRTMTAFYSLADREVEYGLSVAPELSIDQRRRRIIAAKRENGGATKKQEFEDGLSIIVGAPTKLIPLINEYAIIFEFDLKDDFNDFHSLEEFVNRKKRAHIAHSYRLALNDSVEIQDSVTVNMKRYHTVGEFRVGMTPLKYQSEVNL